MSRVIYVSESMHNIEQGGGAVHIPEGDYLLQIEALRPCNLKQWEDTEKNPFMNLRTTIVDGPVRKRPFTELLTWSEEGQFRMGRFLAANGIGRPKVKTAFDHEKFSLFAQRLTGALGGKLIGVVIGDNSYNGKVTSQIVEFYPAEDFEERRGSMMVTQTSAPGPNGSGSSIDEQEAMSTFEESLGDLLQQESSDA